MEITSGKKVDSWIPRLLRRFLGIIDISPDCNPITRTHFNKSWLDRAIDLIRRDCNPIPRLLRRFLHVLLYYDVSISNKQFRVRRDGERSYRNKTQWSRLLRPWFHDEIWRLSLAKLGLDERALIMNVLCRECFFNNCASLRDLYINCASHV